MKMRRQRNDKVHTIFLYALGVMAIAIAFLCLLLNFDSVRAIVTGFLVAFKPILYAVIFVFCVGGIVKAYSKLFTKLFVKGKKTELLCKILSVVLGYLSFLLAIVLLAVIVILPIINSYQDIFATIPKRIEGAASWLEGMLKSLPIIADQSDKIMQYINDSLNISMDSISKYAPIVMEWINKLVSEASNVLLGLIISIYMICSLSYINRVRTKLVHAFLSDEKAERAHNAIEAIKGYFADHFAGRLLYSVIVGMVFYVILWIMGVPFYSFLSTLIGVLSFIPVVGTLTGFGISLLFIFVIDHELVLWFVISYVLIMALGYLFLQKKIIKENARPSMTSSLVAVLIFDGLFGSIGAILAVPAYLSLKYLLTMTLEIIEQKKSMARAKKSRDDDEEDDI